MQFCCCKLKDHSYFLMVNLMVQILFGYQGYESSKTYLGEELNGFAFAVLCLSVLTLIITSIFNFIALIHYIVNDDIRSPFIRFYANALVYLTATAMGLIVAWLITEAVAIKRSETSVTVFIYIFGAIQLILLSFLICWIQNLKEIIAKEPSKDAQTELINNTHEGQATDKANNPDTVRVEA